MLWAPPPKEPGREDKEGPQHDVLFKQPFAVGKFAVTFDEWDACVAENQCKSNPFMEESRREQGGDRRPRMPLVLISWIDAQHYVAWLSKKTGKTYRLLSEAELEYVTRAGTTTRYWWGNSITHSQANYGSKTFVPVDSYAPNPWGLYQVHGNVATWLEDCQHGDYNGAPTDGSAWETPGCEFRAYSQGGYNIGPTYQRSATRGAGGIYWGGNTGTGIRVARTLLAP